MAPDFQLILRPKACSMSGPDIMIKKKEFSHWKDQIFRYNICHSAQQMYMDKIYETIFYILYIIGFAYSI